MAITLRTVKGSALTHSELDANFTNITSSMVYSGSISGTTLTLHRSGSNYAIDLAAIDTTVATGSLMVTGSVTNNTLTFTKGDGSTFNLTVNTGSGGDGGTTPTGSFLTSGSYNENLSQITLHSEDADYTLDLSDLGGISLGALSVTEGAASESGSLSYNNSNGVFTFNPADLSGLGGGSTSPGGSDGQVQYNNGGVFGGESTFTYDDGNNTLTIQGATNQPSIALSNAQSVSISNGSQLSEIQTFYSTDEVGTVAFVAEGAFNQGDLPTRLELRTTNDGASSPTTKLQIKNDGKLIANQYGSGTFTGTAAKYLAVDSSGNVIEENLPAGSFSRPGSATSVIYDTYLASVAYAVDEVGTSPAAPNANGNVSIRYAVSNAGSNVDRIDVYKTDSGATNQSTTLENLSVSGSITLAVTGVGNHTEIYRIVSVADNSTYMSYAVEWESGDDAAFADTEPTMTSTFNSDYEYELSTGYNRLLVTNNSNGAAQRFRMTKPAAAAAGDEVIVELQLDTSGQNIRPAYQVRNGSPSFRKIREVYEVDGTSITRIELDTNDMAIMRFQVNDLGSTEGLTLLGANQMIYA